MNRKSVCILTAGKGTRMGEYSSYVNKVLLPIRKKAVISHIIERFPVNTEFIIALGYLGEQVRDYLQIAHNDRDIKFVSVDKFEGEGSGPGYSLLCCKDQLNKPFYFVSGDTLWTNALDYGLEDKNWLGVSSVEASDSEKYCNFEILDNRIKGVHDKKRVSGPQYKAFVGLCYIKDHDIFWNGLKSNNAIAGEHQVSNGLRALIDEKCPLAVDIAWQDVGDLKKYMQAVNHTEKFDFSKSHEFVYVINGKVIKFFADGTIAKKRVQKALINPGIFPEITDQKAQFYAYKFFNGKTFYEQGSPLSFEKLLKWLDCHLWIKVNPRKEDLLEACKNFYYKKTNDRLKLFYDKYKIKDSFSIINGQEVLATGELLDLLPWQSLYQGVPVFMHGDLHFDHALYDDRYDKFILLDWRHDFAGHVEFGDLYYDLAKLYGGIFLNYDYIKSGLMNYTEEGRNIYFDFAQRYLASVYLKILSRFIQDKGLDLRKVRILVGLIYLNMAGLHQYPFDKILYSLGRFTLFQETKKNSESSK